MTLDSTQSHYPDTELTNLCHILIMLSDRVGSDKYQCYRSLVWLDWKPYSRSTTREACAVPIWLPRLVPVWSHHMGAWTNRYLSDMNSRVVRTETNDQYWERHDQNNLPNAIWHPFPRSLIFKRDKESSVNLLLHIEDFPKELAG